MLAHAMLMRSRVDGSVTKVLGNVGDTGRLLNLCKTKFDRRSPQRHSPCAKAAL